jgi:RNA recognition motif-containing protein
MIVHVGIMVLCFFFFFLPPPKSATSKLHATNKQGYALIEFGKRSEAEAAIKEMDGETLYDKEVHVDWAFVNRESIVGPADGHGYISIE